MRGPATFRDGENAFYLVTPTTSLSQVLTSAPSPKPAKVGIEMISLKSVFSLTNVSQTVRCEKVTAGHLCPNKEIYYGSNAKSICNSKSRYSNCKAGFVFVFFADNCPIVPREEAVLKCINAEVQS